LIRDAGYEPIHLGGLEKARVQESAIELTMAIGSANGPFFYRFEFLGR
jgi:predicted dinucleotide-binding enzyme